MSSRIASPDRQAPRTALAVVLASAVALVLAGCTLSASSGNGPASSSTEANRIPNVIGLSTEEAKAKLETAGYTVAVVQESTVLSPLPEGTVLAQRPSANTDGPPGLPIYLSVAGATQYAEVPMVIGMTLDEATKTIISAGMILGKISYATSPTPKGSVSGQDGAYRQGTAPGKDLAVGSPVSITISTGPEGQIPNVVGMTKEEAIAALTRVGYAVSTEVSEKRKGKPGTVESQFPAAGVSDPTQAYVTIYLISAD